ncbi:MAG: NAD(P)/FAD-dependent oxidoreductase [Dehalococcoidia bacterium]
MRRTNYLIIGNSAGGIGTVESIRSVDEKGTILLVSDELYPAYSRPLISKYLTGERTESGMLYRPVEFYHENKIDCLLGSRVENIDPEDHTAELDTGEKITWEKALLATGGVPIIPRMEGLDKRGVFSFTKLDDAKAIDEFLDEGAEEAVVIGGGLIGISVTEALAKRGLRVTVIEMKDRVLNTILDEQASQIVEERLNEASVEIATGCTVARIGGNSSVEFVTLDNGQRIRCELVVVAIGVLPRTGLAKEAGIEVNRGIKVDRHMATSHPDIYCCGDAAEAHDFVYGENRVIPIWPGAHIGGRVAGYNMAGFEWEYPGGTAMNALNYFGLDITSAGMVTPPDEPHYEMLSSEYDSAYKRIVLRNNIVEGMAFIGDIEKSGMIFSLIRNKVDASEFKHELLADDFGLACLPEHLRQEHHEKPNALAAAGVSK